MIRMCPPSRWLMLALLLVAGTAGAGRYDSGVLWRLSAPDGAVSYLLGTLHAGDPRVTRLPKPVVEALGATERLAVELVEDENAGRRFRSAMVSGEASLPGLLGSDDFARVDGLLERAGVPPQARPRFKAWAALLVLAQPADQAEGTRMDEDLVRRAHEHGKKVLALETIDEQIDSFEGLPGDSQLALLRHASTHQDVLKATVEPMIQAYLARDLAAMYRINESVIDGEPALREHNRRFVERILFARNQRFAERLEPMLREGGVIGAFGALHLFGERGVLALLERKGFRVERVY